MLFKKIFNHEFLRFLISGGIAAGANFFSRIEFEKYFSFIFSVALGYAMGTVVSFFLNKYFTFKSHEEYPATQFIKFVIVAPLAVGLGSLIAYILIILFDILQFGKIIGVDYLKSLAHLGSIGATTIYNYLIMKYYCFKKNEYF
ncbi:MAG: GtrA family protein [Bacteroidota bacterium]